jgi:hypothetical protein
MTYPIDVVTEWQYPGIDPWWVVVKLRRDWWPTVTPPIIPQAEAE